VCVCGIALNFVDVLVQFVTFGDVASAQHILKKHEWF